MNVLKVKKKYLGATTYIKGLGWLTIEPHHGELLAKHGRTQCIEGAKPAKKLTPLKEQTKKELQDKAKDHPDYNPKLTKEELIDLINDTTN